MLLRLNPDLLVAAHWDAVPISRQYVQQTLKLLEERKALFSLLFPWDDPNFGLDPYWVRAYPYRQSRRPGQPLTVEARIFNHSDCARRASAELRAPAGWKVNASHAITIDPHSEGAITLTAVTPSNPPHRLDVLGVAVHFGQRDLGEIAEAIVDYSR